MNAPLLLFDNGDVSLFTSLEALGRYVESPDVAECLATDCNGHIVRLTSASAGQGRRKLLQPVAKVVASPGADVADQHELRRRLLEFLRAISVEADESSSLETLVGIVERSIGYTA